MPRKSGSTNSANYHYLVKKYADNNREEMIEKKSLTTPFDKRKTTDHKIAIWALDKYFMGVVFF